MAGRAFIATLQERRTMLAALDALIANGSGGRPVIALRQVCALFVQIGFDNPDDTLTLFDELMATLAMELDDASIRVIAPELGRLPGVLPAFAATVLSRQDEDELRAAEPHETPVERRARARDPVEDAANPLTMARRASPDELVEIAAQPDLCEAMTGIIASRDFRPAVVACLQNPGARFTRSTLTMLAELAPSDRDLRVALANRQDLPEAVVDRLLPVIGREARARLLMSGPLIPIEEARQELADAEAELAQAGRQGLVPLSIDILAGQVREAKISLDDVVELLAAEARLPELAALATAFLSASYHTMHAMLCARLDHPAAILLKALGAGERSVEAVMALRRRCGFRDARESKRAKAVFNQYAADESRVLLKLIDEQMSAAAVEDKPAANPEFRLALVS
jgi:hypothetical protein